MSEDNEHDLSTWVSTYGIITAQRILERYKITLSPDDLVHALKKQDSFYHHLLRVPLSNVFNGIILQQARDYQLYAQKLFIDYLLSGESGKTEESPGSSTREDLEIKRQELVSIAEAFHALEFTHERLIAKSQKSLMASANRWQEKIKQITAGLQKTMAKEGLPASQAEIMAVLVMLLSDYGKTDDLLNKKALWLRAEKMLKSSIAATHQALFVQEISKLSDLMDETMESVGNYEADVRDVTIELRQFRETFYQFILQTTELIKLLPEYRPNDAQIEENRESLYFDASIGNEVLQK